MTFGVKVKGHGSNKLVSMGAFQGWEKIRTLLIFLVSRCKFRFWRRFYIWPLGSRSKFMGQISWYLWPPGRGEKKFELYWFVNLFDFLAPFLHMTFGVKVKGHGSNKLVSMGARQGWEKIRTLLIFLVSRCKFRFWRRFYIWPLGSRSKVMGQISWYPWAPGRGEKKFELYWFVNFFDFLAPFLHMTFGVKVKGHGSNKLVSMGARQGWEQIRTLLIFLVSRCKFRFWRRFYIWPLGSRSKFMGQISWYLWAPGRGEKKFELYWFVNFFDFFGAVFTYDLWGQGQRSWVK